MWRVNERKCEKLIRQHMTNGGKLAVVIYYKFLQYLAQHWTISVPSLNSHNIPLGGRESSPLHKWGNWVSGTWGLQPRLPCFIASEPRPKTGSSQLKPMFFLSFNFSESQFPRLQNGRVKTYLEQWIKSKKLWCRHSLWFHWAQIISREEADIMAIL